MSTDEMTTDEMTTDEPSTQRLLPITDDLDTGGLFAAARDHRLAIRVCDRCDAVLHVPTAYCHTCGSWEGHWQTVAGTGSLYTWTVVRHQVHPAFPVPYAVVLVDLDDRPGTRLIGQVPGEPALHAGMPMEVWFEAIGDDVELPQWRPSGGPPTDR